MLEDALRTRYPGTQPGHPAILKRVIEVCRWYLDAGLGDADAVKRLESQNYFVYWQQLSEVLIARELHQNNLNPRREKNSPDFLIEHSGKRIWIEAICPEPHGLPSEWLEHEIGTATYMPNKEMLLRWTSAIKEKFQKLVGKQKYPETGYISRGVVRSDDCYVIAVNGRLLRDRFPDLTGISQTPFPVEATLSVGPIEVIINTKTLDIVESGIQYRPVLPKSNGSPVPADIFFDPLYASVSAVWGVDFDESTLFGRQQPSLIVHNHLAKNPLKRNLIPVQYEYVAIVNDDSYTIQRSEGATHSVRDIQSLNDS